MAAILRVEVNKRHDARIGISLCWWRNWSRTHLPSQCNDSEPIRLLVSLCTYCTGTCNLVQHSRSRGTIHRNQQLDQFNRSFAVFGIFAMMAANACDLWVGVVAKSTRPAAGIKIEDCWWCKIDSELISSTQSASPSLLIPELIANPWQRHQCHFCSGVCMIIADTQWNDPGNCSCIPPVHVWRMLFWIGLINNQFCQETASWWWVEECNADEAGGGRLTSFMENCVRGYFRTPINCRHYRKIQDPASPLKSWTRSINRSFGINRRLLMVQNWFGTHLIDTIRFPELVDTRIDREPMAAPPMPLLFRC